MTISILVDPAGLPEDLPVMISGIVSRSGGDASAWAGSGKNAKRIDCKVTIYGQEPSMNGELEPEGDDEQTPSQESPQVV